jgi:beta-xylosidase
VAATLALAGLIAACSSPGDERSTSSTSTGTATSTTSTTSTSTTSTTSPPPDLPAGVAFDGDFPDPFVLASGDHLAFATTSGLIHLQGLRSTGLTGWAGPGEVLAEVAAWATPYSSWAPAVLAIDGRFLLYYTAQVAGTDKHCISVATAATPSGPFVDDRATPLLCPMELGGAIDPSPFVDTDGRRYLLWKSDGVTLRRESAIWSQPLDDDGLGFAGPAVALIGTDQTWEYPHVEAPSMALVDGTYWLAYSGNWWNQDAYGVGLARCEGPVGPCDKPYDHAVLTSSPGRAGPGGAEFFRDRSGRLLVAYHAWTDEPGYPGRRALFLTEPVVVDGLVQLPAAGS